jgi:hypothetical protein
MPRSHFAAAMATSRSSLCFAPRNIRIRLQINFRSPKVNDSHQSNRRTAGTCVFWFLDVSSG